jgi:predicted phosphoribosyltransferase
MLFRDRVEAGRFLAAKLRRFLNRSDVIVLALPRGGVPVAYQVATALDLPMDIFIVRKLGVPGHEELAMGAIASGGVRVSNEDVVQSLKIPESVIETAAAMATHELERRETYYRYGAPPLDIKNKTVILIDDGLATGATMRAAAKALRRKGVKEIVIAVPVAAPSTCKEFESEVDQIICGATPEPFYGVGSWYKDFSQTSDDEVIDLLQKAHAKITEKSSLNQ